ncbi:MAG: serine/threonine-protein kinase [Polyangiales bacterium]
MTAVSLDRSPPPVEIGQMLAEKYRVERVLGEGGMGLVVLATHVELDQQVAIKCLLPEAAKNATAVDRFAREARACAKLRGENVVHVTDVGILESGAPFMVMEYLQGEDLEQHLLTRGPLAVDDAIHYVLEACAGLSEAHAAGIIHRDLKPANLFLATRSDTGCVLKVVDFGISRLLEAPRNNLTSTQDLMGSPLYMSPEQLRSLHDVDERADIWAMGIILYELLAGVPPFQGDTLPQICSAVLVNEPPSLAEVRSELPEGLHAVVAKCLEKDADNRYRTATELAEALAMYAPARSAATLARIARMSMSQGIEMAPPSSHALIDVRADTAFVEAPAPVRGSRWKVVGIVLAVVLAAIASFALGRRHMTSPAVAPAASSLAASSPVASALVPPVAASSATASATVVASLGAPPAPVVVAPLPVVVKPRAKKAVPQPSAAPSASAAASEEEGPYDDVPTPAPSASTP